MPLEHVTTPVDPSWGVGAEWVKVACKPFLSGWPDLGNGQAMRWRKGSCGWLEWGYHAAPGSQM